MGEARITINGRALTGGQALTLRIAATSWALELQDDPNRLGDDEQGRKTRGLFLARIIEVLGMLNEPGDG